MWRQHSSATVAGRRGRSDLLAVVCALAALAVLTASALGAAVASGGAFLRPPADGSPSHQGTGHLRLGLASEASSGTPAGAVPEEGSSEGRPSAAAAPHAAAAVAAGLGLAGFLALAGASVRRGAREAPLPLVVRAASPELCTFACGAAASGPQGMYEARRSARAAAAASAAGVGSLASSSCGAAHGVSACALLGGSVAKVAVARPGARSIGAPAVVTRMAMMFERFTEKTIKAVMMAQAESRRLGQDHVGTEMLVVGIISEGTDMGFRALAQVGVKLAETRATLEELVGHGIGGKALEIPFTTGAKKVLEDSIECARDQGSSTVSTAHLLHAIIRQEEGNGAKLMCKVLGSESEEQACEQVLQALTKEENAGRTASSKASPQSTASASPLTGANGVDLTQTLKYGQDLTLAAREGRLDPLVGRSEELKRTIRILGRRSKNNPVLVGEAGVGKTSIAHGLAQRIAEGRVPPGLSDKRVVQLDLALLLAGTRYRGDFEERLRAVVKEVAESKRTVILVIDEVHTLVGAGSGGGADGGGIDAANLLKPALARGELQCIGATTLDEYRKYIERDPALERRFQPVTVPEPSQDETVQILEGLAPKYEKHHQLRYTPQALVAAVKLASQYIADRFLPDKAIDVMDEAGSKVRQQISQAEDSETAAERWAIRQELEEVQAKKKAAVAVERYDEAQQLKLREVGLLERLDLLEQGPSSQGSVAAARLIEELRALKAQMHEAAVAERFAEAHELKAREVEVLQQLSKVTGGQADSATALLGREVTEEDVAQVVAGWTGIAVEQVGASESSRLLQLEAELHRSIIGQDEAVQSVSRALRRARAGLRNPERPIAGFMFSGPTGVGKTALCKTLASTFFGTDEAMIRLDMSEYMEKHTVSKLIGAPPGYVGYSDGGTLTESLRRRPYSLVLFDEVEKAHPDVFNMLLQLLDDGRLTDSKGRTVSFANALVVMTSNLGSRSVQKGATGGLGLGFGTGDDTGEQSYSKMKELVHEEMKSFFRPEFLNRLDEIVVFRSLTREDVRAIAEVEFRKVLERLRERNLEVTLTPRFKERVLEEGYDPAYGARPLRRAITRMLEDTLAEALLADVELGGEAAGASAAGFNTPCEGAPPRRVELDVAEDGSVVVQQSTSAAPALAGA